MEKNYFYIDEGQFDAHLFHEGTYYKSHEFLGAHKLKKDGREFVRFIVWAANAREVFLMGDFNKWHISSLPLQRIPKSGLWSICLEGVEKFDSYKYRIISAEGEELIKADPYAFHAEERPKSASKYYPIEGYKWSDKKWMKERKKNNDLDGPISIYEVNLLSWKKKEGNIQYSYEELADELVRYVRKMRYTHIELMPVMEHPYDGSWGYQITGYFAPTSRFGTPKDFMNFVDKMHRAGIGVILDWVPAHFAKDGHGLQRFDGSYLFESLDRRKAENHIWGSYNFDFSKPEVLSFLISNIMYWIEYYHIDGIRIDAVSYMLYYKMLGQGVKNIYGGDENLEALEFFKRLNSVLTKNYPDVLMIAEESTSFEGLTKPLKDGGLGFDLKWNMGWMNDTLEYMEKDPLYKKGVQGLLTFGIMYAFSERFILPLSHDEVVHMKKSLLDKMPGSYEEKFSNLRLLYLYMYAYPGKKLLFMGGEIAQFKEWDEWGQLDWNLLEYESHSKIQDFVRDLNVIYKEEKALFQLDSSYEGFSWIEHENHQESILAFERISKDGERLVCVFNFTPVERRNYPLGVSEEGNYRTIVTSDHRRYGGETPRIKRYKSKEEAIHDRAWRIDVDLPALGGLILKKII